MKILFINIFLVFLMGGGITTDFKAEQKRYSRVRNAFNEKELLIKEMCAEKGLSYSSLELYIRAFKLGKKLEVWARDDGGSKFELLKTYDFCTGSGQLGPKREQGDGQIPEGFYHIDRFNPSSAFHLSLGINYPNKADKKKTSAKDPGGDIFIHGNCVSIGCIPITDDLIKELYILCVQAKSCGQDEIPVHIFPLKFNEHQISVYAYFDLDLIHFWKNLKEGYDYFETHRKIPQISVNNEGDYVIKKT